MSDTLYRFIRPFLHSLDPENAHTATIMGLKGGFTSEVKIKPQPVLATKLWGIDFPTPVGLAAGFDKDAEVMDKMLALGFGFVEAGTVTPLPQPGNPRPRLFRLDEDLGVINRFGFNSKGLRYFVENLQARRERKAKGIVGANVGKNRDTVDAASDYAIGIEAVCRHADYLVCNISSPNTPGLRNLQAREQIRDLIVRVLEARAKGCVDMEKVPPLLAKVGPDLDEQQMSDIAEVALATNIDGLIVGNTTIDRPDTLHSRYKNEAGGLSGPPLLAKANACLSRMYALTDGKIPIVGCGGIASGADAYSKIRAGASLVQLYSSLVFYGPDLIRRVTVDLGQCLRMDGFKSVTEAVGADHRST